MTRYAVRVLLAGQVAASSTIEAKNRFAAIQEAVARLERDGHDTSKLEFEAQPYEGGH